MKNFINEKLMKIRFSDHVRLAEKAAIQACFYAKSIFRIYMLISHDLIHLKSIIK